MDIKIEKMTITDLNNIKHNLNTDFDDFWNYNVLKEEIENNNSQYIVAKVDNEVVGFAGIKIIMDEADIMNIVTKKSFRKIKISTNNKINISEEKFKKARKNIKNENKEKYEIY